MTEAALYYTFPVTCPNERRCGAGRPLVHENGTNTRRTARTVLFCPVCHSRFLLVVELTLLDPPGRPPGGAYMNTPVPVGAAS